MTVWIYGYDNFYPVVQQKDEWWRCEVFSGAWWWWWLMRKFSFFSSLWLRLIFWSGSEFGSTLLMRSHKICSFSVITLFFSVLFFLLCFKTLQYYLKPWSLKLKKVISSDTGYLQFPETDDPKFKGALWTFKQWLTLKLRVRYGISTVLLQTSSHKAVSGYAALKRNKLRDVISVWKPCSLWRHYMYNFSFVKDSFTAMLP